MAKDVYEYRINKKGCEIFRSRSFDEIKAKLEEFHSKSRPGVFTVQMRSCRCSNYGVLDTVYEGKPSWSCWR